MHASPRIGFPRKTVIVAVGLLAAISAAAAMAPEPIVGPQISIGETGAAVADPLVPVPPETPCVVKLYSADSPSGTFDDYANHPFSYAPPAGCNGPWNKVVFKADFNVTTGRQYDRTASVWIGGANVYFGTTQEPSASRSPSWHVERDVTDLSSLLMSAHPGNAAVYNIYSAYYNGSITGSAELDFYPATPEFPAPRVPDQVLALGSSPAGSYSYINNTQQLSRTFTLPRNIERAYLDVIAEPQSNDEFWYTCVPDDLTDTLESCGGTGFRETEVYVDGKPAGLAPVSGWIFTGGIDPYLWRPIPGVQTLNFKPFRVDLTPFAGLLDDGQPHTVSVGVYNATSYFALSADLLLYQDADGTQLSGALVQDNDSGLHPVISVSHSSDGSHYSVKTSSQHDLATRGYLDTPHGRVFSNVVQQAQFENAQQFTLTDTQYRQTIQQTSSVSSHSFGSPQDGGPANTKEDWSFPLTMDINLLFASDGSFSQATTVDQHFSLSSLAGGPGGAYAFDRSQGDSAADTLNFHADGSYGRSGQQSTQSYEFNDSNGSCYSRTVDSVAGAVTQVQDGAACRN